MATDKADFAQSVVVNGKQLECLVCGAKMFHHRHGIISSRKQAFFNFEWLNKDADVYVCDQCGYVHWFYLKQ